MNFVKNLKIKNMKTSIIGLDKRASEELVKKLNTLLANYQVYYQSVRGLRWNIKGKYFFDLHLKFEDIYTDSQEKVDMIAERILTLGGAPIHTFGDYIKVSNVPVGKNISNDTMAVELILNSLSQLLIIERLILDQSGNAGDEGTNAMMSDFISEQEKTIWMMKAWLS
jgi:starvation-inducible DNA-binding protein